MALIIKSECKILDVHQDAATTVSGRQAQSVLLCARKLPMSWYCEFVELVLAIRSEGVPQQKAEARAYAAILARMRWPVFKEGTDR